MHFKVISPRWYRNYGPQRTFYRPETGIAEGTLFIEIDAAALSGDRNKVKIGPIVAMN